MIHLRLIVPAAAADRVVDHLASSPGVAHLARLPGAAVVPAGDVVWCDVARESANGVIEWLQDQGVHHDGSITIDPIDAVVSDAAKRAIEAAPGQGADALIWEEIEARARDESTPSLSFLAFMAIAAIISVVGILLDAPILIVGAMVVGPEYGPIAAACIALARGRFRAAGRALVALAGGFGFAAVASLVATALFRMTGLAPDAYSLSSRQLTAFIAHPDAMAAVVAVLAGAAGMLSLTEGRAGALVGVLVSVTTIPAVANVGVAAAYARWGELAGSAEQLGVNVLGLTLAGVTTLAVQSRLTTSRATPRSDGRRVPG